MNISLAAILLFNIAQLSLLGILLRRRRRTIDYDYDDGNEHPLQQYLHQSKPYTRYRYTIYRINNGIY